MYENVLIGEEKTKQKTEVAKFSKLKLIMMMELRWNYLEERRQNLSMISFLSKCVLVISLKINNFYPM